MTALARGDSTADRGKVNVNDRKFAFLNQITRPDYRSLHTNGQSSVPATPVSIPLQTNGEQLMFREFGAPIATPEDEDLVDDLEIKSEPLLSPRRRFLDFDEKENREEDEEEDTTIREEIMTVEEENAEISTKIEEKPEKTEEIPDFCAEKSGNSGNFGEKSEEVQDLYNKPSENVEKVEEKSKKLDFFVENSISPDPIRLVESAPQLTISDKFPKESDDFRKLTESYGEPTKAVLETVYIGETDDDETETETEEEEDLDDDVRRQIAAVSDEMVFGFNGRKSSKERMEKPTSLQLNYEIEADCSTPRRAEFSINPEEEDDPSVQSSSGDEGVLQQSLIQLQKQLRKTDVRCSRLEKICEFQQRDIDSLRFEVDWKDKRIEYLQKTLQQMELSQSTSTDDATSSRSTSTS